MDTYYPVATNQYKLLGKHTDWLGVWWSPRAEETIVIMGEVTFIEQLSNRSWDEHVCTLSVFPTVPWGRYLSSLL